MPTTVRIESGNRWDTLDLVSRLSRWRWFSVERDPECWDVYVQAEQAEEDLRGLVAVAERWARDRELEAVAHLPDGDVRVVPD